MDLHPDIAEYLRKDTTGKTGLLFHTANRTPYLNNKMEGRLLTPKLISMGLGRKALASTHSSNSEKTWLRGQRCLEDISNFWMAHRPQTMFELYSHLQEELQLRLDEAERVGYGFALPVSKDASVVPIVQKSQQKMEQKLQRKCRRMLVVP